MKIHSEVNLITNSSSELFIIKDQKFENKGAVKSRLAKDWMIPIDEINVRCYFNKPCKFHTYGSQYDIHPNEVDYILLSSNLSKKQAIRLLDSLSYSFGKQTFQMSEGDAIITIDTYTMVNCNDTVIQKMNKHLHIFTD